MMPAVKLALLLLLVFKATALEKSQETDSNHELFLHSSPSPSPSPLPSTDIGEQKKSTEGCLAKCLLSCMNKGFFGKAMCIANCYTKCFAASNSLDQSDCLVDCAHSSPDTLRNDATVISDRISSSSSSCHQQCNRD